MFNLKDLTNKKIYQRLLSLLMVIAIICSARPCNCMAETTTSQKQSSNEHPCHSSKEAPVDNKSTHKGCCCTDASFLSAANLDIVKISDHANILEKFKVNYILINPVSINGLLTDVKLIRGSPPTSDLFSISSKSFLALFGRWLI